MKVIVVTERQQALLVEMCKCLIRSAKVAEELAGLFAPGEPIPPEAKKEIQDVEVLCELIRSAPDSH